MSGREPPSGVGRVLQKRVKRRAAGAEIALPEFAPAESDLGTKAELWRMLTLGNARELVGGLLRRVDPGADDLRIPDGMHDLEELPLVPHPLAERAGPLIIGLTAGTL